MHNNSPRELRFLIKTQLYNLCGEYMFHAAKSKEEWHNGNDSVAYVNAGIAEGFISSAKKIEFSITGATDSCLFVEKRTQAMLSRQDIFNAIEEVYIMAKQAKKCG